MVYLLIAWWIFPWLALLVITRWYHLWSLLSGFPDPKSSTGPQDEKVVDIVQLGAHVNRATSDPQRYVAVGCGSQASFLWVVTCSNHHITTQRE